MHLKKVLFWPLELAGLRQSTATLPQTQYCNVLPPPQTESNNLAQRTQKNQGDTIYILVVGRSGSGKSHMINTVRSDFDQRRTWFSNQGTLDVKSHHIQTFPSGVNLELIDVPGFHNVNMSDVDVFLKVSQYVLSQGVKDRITGVIYVHPAGDDLQSEILRRNLQALLDIFLGATGLARLTILVIQPDPQGVDPQTVVNEIRRPNSTHTFSKACAGGANAMAIRFTRDDLFEVLNVCASKTPIVLPIHQYNQHDLSALKSYLNDTLGYYSRQSVQSHVASLQTQLGEAQSNLTQSNSKATFYEAECNRLKQRCMDQEKLKEAVDQRLRQIEQEYASLRSQYQLKNSIEQKDIVQGLLDLNFKIRRLSQALSTHLIDHYVQTTFSKEPDQVTTLDAFNLPQLGLGLEIQHDDHSDQSSLLKSRNGSGRDIDSFFDFALCSLLCTLLAKTIFQPFHPHIMIDQSHGDEKLNYKGLVATYREVQKQEPQYMAGKWRSITLKGIYNSENLSAADQHIMELTRQIFNNCSNHLVIHFLGQSPDSVEFLPQHFEHCRQLVEMAWKWNQVLKEEVIMLGDFEQTIYTPGSEFDPTLMEELERSANGPQPEYILGTLGLGLISSRAVGGGRPPEKTVVCKAVVVTDHFYDVA